MAAAAGSSRLRRAVAGRVVLVTGSSEGIGARLAQRLAAAGACLALVARSADKLEQVQGSILAAGGDARTFVADLSDEGDCGRVLSEILATLGRVDIFVSNAGRSIRRSMKYQGGGRFHDFKRLMDLNYFGALRLVLGLLPGMEQRGFGQVIHISSFGVPTRQPRFAGYCASKAALDAALQSAVGEVAASGVHMSTVYMPLVQTKMVQSRGHSYDHISLLSVDLACEYIEHAIVSKRIAVMDAPTFFLSLMHMIRPSLVATLNSLVYRLEKEKAPDDFMVTHVPAATQDPSQIVKICSADKAGGGGGAPQRARRSITLNILGTLLWFFSRAEMALCLHLGVPWLARDLFAMLVLALVLVVQPLVVVAMSLSNAALCLRAL